MKVFISWSGATSKALAEILRDWLPNVIQAIEPWMSAEDIDKGTWWFGELAGQLQEHRFGIICLNPDNIAAPWILFEAGALSKAIGKTYVCPYLFHLRPTDIPGNSPLAQFQASRSDKEDTKRLLITVNKALDKEALPEVRFNAIFEKWWPDLEEKLRTLQPANQEVQPKREEREILEEILTVVRQLHQSQAQLPFLYPAFFAPEQLLKPSLAGERITGFQSLVRKSKEVQENPKKDSDPQDS